jgi:hypothetical protein
VKGAKELHSHLFRPPLSEPIDTVDVPLAGRAYSGGSMELILKIIELAQKGHKVRGSTGAQTVELLQHTFNLVSLIVGKHDRSLGLHPAIYFYNHSNGRHQPEALLAMLRWISELKERQWLPAFTKCRRSFEDFLILNSHMVSGIITKKGTLMRSVPTVIAFYDLVLRELMDAADFPRVFRKLHADEKLKFFVSTQEPPAEYGNEISDAVKSSVFLKEALKGIMCCKICDGRHSRPSHNWDHITKECNDGKGSPQNVRQTHPYCNSNRDVLEATIAKHRQRTGERF